MPDPAVYLVNFRGQAADDPCAGGACDLAAWLDRLNALRDAGAVVAQRFTVRRDGKAVFAAGVTSQGWDRFGQPVTDWIVETENYLPAVKLGPLQLFEVKDPKQAAERTVAEIRQGLKLIGDAEQYLATAAAGGPAVVTGEPAPSGYVVMRKQPKRELLPWLIASGVGFLGFKALRKRKGSA